MGELKFTIDLIPRTKKNSQRIAMIGGYPRILPSKAYVEYEKAAGAFMPRLTEPIDRPVNIQAIYYMPTRRQVDLNNLHEALCDCLAHYKIIKDDNCNIVASMDGSKVRYDKEHPRTEITITKGEAPWKKDS